MNNFISVENHAAPDPFITFDNRTGYYYCCFTMGSSVTLYRSKKLETVITGGDTCVAYAVHEGSEVFDCIWAPEMNFFDGKWYIYTSGRNNPNKTPVPFVLESKTADPFDGFIFKAFLNGPDYHAIDCTTFEKDNVRYICMSSAYTYGQVLLMAVLKTPWSVESQPVAIAQAQFDWEKLDPANPGHINEGAFFVEKNGRTFIIYSANGCFCDDYCLGLLELTGDNLLDSKSWTKFEKPIFEKANGVYAPGHASFFHSPDGSELWIAFHTYYNAGNVPGVCVNRYCQVQKIDFDETGFPILNKPLAKGTNIPSPSGEAE